MVYELRSYDIAPDKLDEYLAWANNKALPLLVGVYGFRLVGFWKVVPKTGEPAPTTNVHWIIAWESEAEMNEKWAAARASDAWKEIAKETVDANGNPVYHMRRQSNLLKAIPRSPFQ